MAMKKTAHKNIILNVIFSNKLHYVSLLIIFILASWMISYGQSAKVWCFGNYAGVNFNSSPPTVFTTSLMNTPEGCASIGGGNGQLKFYTNGKKLWDENHNVILYDLNGSIYSTQSSLIIKHPKTKNNLTYIFTTDAMGGGHGLQYTVFKNNTLVSKNNSLLGTATERLTVALHCNEHDFWIVTHAWNSNAFYAYKLTKYGLETIPVISNAGSIHNGNYSNGAGCLKASQKGNFIAQAIMGSGKLEVFRFDRQNGEVYDPITIPNIPDAYGVEFSPEENYLYVTSASGGIFQFDLQNYNSTDVLQSRQVILQSTQLTGALQLASDQKIYVSVDNKYYLGAITKPHMSGLSCNYDPNYIYLNGKKTDAGLPPEIPYTCYMDMIANTPCIGDTSWFDFNKCDFLIDSVLWDFGDTTTTLDSSTSLKPWYIYPKPGNYDAVLYVFFCGSVDTVIKDILILQKPFVNLGPDTSICANEPLILHAGTGPNFLWNTGSTSSSIYVTQAGTYWVKASNICGDSYDTITIKNIWPIPYVSLPADTDICYGDSIILFAGDSNYIYIWQSADTALYYTAKDAGTYQLTAITEHNCKSSDDFMLSITFPPQVMLGNDTSICIGNSIILDAGYGYDYLWNNGLMTQNYLIDTSGLVFINVSNKCGYASDTINIIVEDCEQKIYIPNCFTPNGDGENDLFFPQGYSIDWNTLEMCIYNRWGEQLYFTNDVNKGWDGTNKKSNKLCPLGVYAWLILVKDVYGNDIKLTGTVTLLR